MMLPAIPRRIGLPLAMQMIAILVCALLAAQAVTLGLTVLLPPRPAVRWDMTEVAAALAAGETPQRLDRRRMSGPPDVSGQGWLVSESSRLELARRLKRPESDIVLAFYTQLPVGGIAVPSNSRSPLAEQVHPTTLGSLFIDTAQAHSIPGGPPGGGPMGPAGGPGGFPGGMPPGGSLPRVPSMPGGGMPRGNPSTSGMPQSPGMPGGSPRPSSPSQVPGAPAGGAAQPGGAMPGGGQPPMQGRGGMPGNGLPPGGAVPTLPTTSILPSVIPPHPEKTGGPVRDAKTTEEPQPVGPSSESPQVSSEPMAGPAANAVDPAAESRRPAPVVATPANPQPIPFRRPSGSLFELASPPFIEGDFIAAMRQADGTWLAVAPKAEPFPNAWQRRVMLWFALSLAIVSPLAWLFARRIVLPLRDFAQAAEQLGRDPSATILPLSGPAEIGRAANAFNQMRNRLRAFVDDRTAMVGAISHDLRTPLTRLRFRIEDVPDEQRDGLLKEVTEMEAMISQVIAFIRDASTPGPRERIDFADLVTGSVADARLVGSDVEIERNAHIPVDVDPVGIRRLLGNLLENAVKYGERARVRVSLSDGEAIAEIIDAGPGIPDDEFDRAFEPFFRGESARASGLNGSGLGLAVCRSIARAHGGDVTLAHERDGFMARVRVPAAFDTKLLQAA